MATGSDEAHRGAPPPIPDGVSIRLFSMEFCPFADRARLALSLKGLPHDVINCDLSNKPDCLLNVNPNGTVPAMIHGDVELYESDVIVEYLDNAFPASRQLFSKDPAKCALGRILSSNQAKIITSYYKAIYGSRNGPPSDELASTLCDNIQKYAEEPLGKLGEYFGGDEPTAVDFLIFPWLCRLEILSRNLMPFLEFTKKFPRVTAWVAKIRAIPAVQATLVLDEHQEAFLKAYMADTPRPYNLGSKHPMYAGSRL